MGVGVTTAEEEPRLVDRLLASWGRIQTMTCTIREDTRTVMGVTQSVSRISYERPNHINIDRTGFESCRIIADGRMYYYRQPDQEPGIGVPIRDLDAKRRLVLQSVPGSPMEYLLPLIQAPETNMSALADLPIRRGYSTSNTFVVLSCDAIGRLCRVETFPPQRTEARLVQHDYSIFVQIATNCWIPTLQEMLYNESDGTLVERKRRLDDLVVNQPLSPALFNYTLYFPGVTFTNFFDKPD